MDLGMSNINFNISNYDLVGGYPGCSLSPLDAAPQFFIEPESVQSQMMHAAYVGITLIGTLVSRSEPLVGTAIQTIAQTPKITRNMLGYKQTFTQALTSDSISGAARLVSAVTAILFPPARSALAILNMALFILEEATLMRNRENIKVQVLFQGADTHNDTKVIEQIGQMKIHRPNFASDCNPLFLAVHNSSPFIVDQFASLKSADLNPTNSKGNTPLSEAVAQNDMKLVDSFLNLDGVDIDRKNNAGDSPVAIAVNQGSVGMAGLLALAGANVNFYGRNAVHLAHRCYNMDSLPMFHALSKNLEFNRQAQDMFGKTIYER